MKRTSILLTAILLMPFALFAADYGLIIDQNAGIGAVSGAGSGAEPAFDYKATVIPSVSTMFGDWGDLYISAGLTFNYDKGTYFIPELLRAEMSWRFEKTKVTAGRMFYTAPFSQVADGLFDGVQLAYDSPIGMFNAGAWYTGLLYKKRTAIIMTAEEETAYYFMPLDFDNFTDTYFASKRMVASLGYEHPAIGELLRTKLAVIAQVDLNGRDDYLNSQYFTAQFSILKSMFMVELGGAFELIETSGGFKTGLAGSAGFYVYLPSDLPSRLSLNGYFSSGTGESGSLAAFIPITAKFHGDVLQAPSSGISTITLGYSARLHPQFSLSVTSMYAIRSDLGTFRYYPLGSEESEGFFLGNEFFARLIYAPASDLQFNLGGGIFLPSMGNAAPQQKPMWRIELAAVLAVF